LSSHTTPHDITSRPCEAVWLVPEMFLNHIPGTETLSLVQVILAIVICLKVETILTYALSCNFPYMLQD
jgi:hypothetical protein